MTTTLSSLWRRYGGAFPLYISQGFSALVPFLVAPLILKYSSIDELGVYAGWMTLATFLCIFSEYSFDYLGPKLLSGIEKNNELTFMGSVIRSKIVLLIVSMPLVTPLVFMVFQRGPTFAEMISLYGLGLGLALCNYWYFIYLGKSILVALTNIASKVILVILVIGYIYVSPVIEGRVIFSLHALSALASGTYIYIFRISSKQASRSGFSVFQLLREGRLLFLSNLSGSLISISGPLAIGVAANEAGMAIYHAADKSARLVSAVYKPILQWGYSRSIRSFAASFRQGVERLAEFRSILLWTLSLLLLAVLFFGGDFLNFFFDKEVSEKGALVFQLLTIWVSIGIVNNCNGLQGLVANGKYRQYNRAMLGALCVVALSACLTIYGGFTDYGVIMALGLILAEAFAFVVILVAYREMGQQ